MNTMLCSVLVFLVLMFGTFPCRGEEPIKTEQSSLLKNPSALLKNEEMVDPLNRNLNAVKIAKREIAEFQKEVKDGKIKVENNNGIWCAVFGKNEKIVRLANYASPNGPMDFFTKRVYPGNIHSNEIHALGYDIYFYTNSQIKTYRRRDWAESVDYFDNGRIRSFFTPKSNGVYSASWDTNGCLIQEGTSKGVIEKEKLKDVSQPATNQTVSGVPQIPGSGKTNEEGTGASLAKP